MSDWTQAVVFKLGFDLARRLAEPGFRQRLRKARKGNKVYPLIPAVYDESVESMTDRMTNYDKGLIVIEDSREPKGVRLIWWEKR